MNKVIGYDWTLDEAVAWFIVCHNECTNYHYLRGREPGGNYDELFWLPTPSQLIEEEARQEEDAAYERAHQDEYEGDYDDEDPDRYL